MNKCVKFCNKIYKKTKVFEKIPINIDVRVDVQNNGTNAVEEAEETIANIENAAQTTSGVIENLEDIKEPEEEVPIITQVNIKEENKNNKKIPEDK